MRSAHRPRSRRPISAAAAVIVLAGLLPAPLRLAAQGAATASPPPEEVADAFNRGFQSMAWEGLSQRIHPEALAQLRHAADILVQVDTSGYVLDALLGGLSPGGYARLTDTDVLVRVLGGVQRELPGLLSSLVSRRTEVLGVVPEGSDRHVVYRLLMLVQGAEPEIRVMTLTPVEGRWLVRRAQDIDVLLTAIRGIPLPRARTP